MENFRHVCEAVENNNFLRAASCLSSENVDGYSGGYSLLMIAVNNSNDLMVKLLLEKGADLALKTDDEDQALHFAIQSKNLEIINMLIDAGADVNAMNMYGVTPLSLASVDSNIELVKLLLSSGAKASNNLISTINEMKKEAETGGHFGVHAKLEMIHDMLKTSSR